MIAQGAARSYARALFALAQERKQTETIGRELDLLANAVADEAALADFLARPWVPAPTKRKVAADVAARLGVSKLSADFLALVAAQGRANQLSAIRTTFRGLMDADAGRVRARVRTAAPLGEAERGRLAGRLAQALATERDGKRPTVILEEIVDPQLLGGFVAEIGSLVVDGSLDGQLARMRQRLGRG